MSNEWRFPGNNYTQETGLDTSDMETFKKDPTASLARELCQNSIDAKLEGSDDPVRIEFKSFDINRQDFPGVERLENEIRSCRSYNSKNKKLHRQLTKMEEAVKRSQLRCLRVSDFNTYGLKGVENNKDSPWYLLTKGSGISNKIGSKGGSKGIGKFATFVTSEIQTVFYSTRTADNEMAYQGISKLCSTTMEGTDEKTQGTGYFGSDKRNRPILEYKSLDPSFYRKPEEIGTDVFIVGFKNGKSWKSEITTMILDSFMVAIIRGELEVEVDDIKINNENLDKIVNDENLILKKHRKNIRSQYILQTDKSVYRTVLDISNYGEVELYIKGFSRHEDNIATNKYLIVRYPYMKIKEYKVGISIPCSAMCVIEDNTLNEILRDCENPQHTDWYTGGITDSAKKKEVIHVIKELRSKITDEISNFLASGDNEETDVEGASDYLPDNREGDEETPQTDFGDATPRFINPIKNRPVQPRGLIDDDDSLGAAPDVGSVDDEGEDAEKPEGENESSGGTAGPTNEPGGKNEGNSDIIIREKLKDINYRFIVEDRKNSLYRLIFTSPYQEEQAEIRIAYIDDSGSKNKVTIEEATIFNDSLDIDDGKIVFNLEKGKKYNIRLKPQIKEIFSSEVSLYARR